VKHLLAWLDQWAANQTLHDENDSLRDELRDVLDENVALHRKTTILASQIPKFRVAEIAMLELWQALGGDPVVFLDWFTEPGRTPADAWSQLLGAVAGDLMAGDTNPEPGAILALVWNRTVEG